MVTYLTLCSRASYQIVVQGILSETWQLHFDDLTLSIDQDAGLTIFTGIIQDQSHLIGTLRRINGLAMPIIKVECLSTKE